MNQLRQFDIKFLKGVGPQRAQLLEKELGIRSAYDLVRHFPTSYADRSTIYRVADFRGDMPSVMIKGRFISFNVRGEGAKTRLVGLFSDGTGTVEIVWFNRINQIKTAYHQGVDYYIFGKPQVFNGYWSITHPEVDTEAAAAAMQGLRGVYPLTERLRNRGITSRMMYMWIQTALAARPNLRETLPPSMMATLRLMPIGQALANIHHPSSLEAMQQAKFRLKFEELLYIQVDMLRRSRSRKQQLVGTRFPKIGYWFNKFYSECLPFELTGAQKRVIKEIRADVNTGRQMNRLLQGDVGSGKTLVALLSMLIAIDNGAQACLMAPTEILATQHFETLSQLTAPIGLNVKLLTGSTGKKKRDEIHQQLLDGTLHILVGTHAVIEDKVEFRNLGFVVIDEQHRFGVAQRAKMWRKNAIPPHVLVMTATPIPRTLAMTVYGDLDVSVIDELPPGRKPVTTALRYDEQRHQLYQFLYKELAAGRQAYIVYPLIEENEKLDLLSLTEGYEMICQTFPNNKVAFVHGKMKPAEKDYQMGLFASHQADILVATTVIEVGVNVPNASVMIIENAERFGLSQLHQLRGRVGRGADQSYCVLMTKRKIAKETRERLSIMTQTTDGFVVAEADMKMRGPGDIEGTMQSGLPFDLRIANLATDGQIIQLARQAAEALLDDDPALAKPENLPLRTAIELTAARTADWSRIS
ncbi:MAG: ATP-dependent DNA helicase RecG [Muribaculaceae bacterium]|nr:ATP-dependent DNA helicase RecG [Muribaculaceae bacterium]